MENRVLQKYVYKTSGSIKIMDEFESTNNKNEKIYDTLELQDLFFIMYRKRRYSISLLVQRKNYDQKCIYSSLTFTDMKKEILNYHFFIEDKNSYKVIHETFEGIKNNWNSKESETLYQFPVPVQFNAQNSSNRCGYGNQYCGEELVWEGTLYGETSDYIFVGAKYRRWW